MGVYPYIDEKQIDCTKALRKIVDDELMREVVPWKGRYGLAHICFFLFVVIASISLSVVCTIQRSG